jgi:O-antigen/teichoic acid export membrane protein
MRNRKLVVNSIYYTIGEILPKVIGFFLLPLLTKYLSPADYGINSYTNTVMLFSFAFSSLSLNTFLLRNYYKEENIDERKKIIWSVFSLSLATNAVVSGIELVVFPWLLSTWKIAVPFYPFFLLAILNNFLEGFSIIPLVLYRIRQNARLFVTINASKTILQFALTYVLLTSCHYGLVGVYLARLAVNIPYTLLFLVIVYQASIRRVDVQQIRRGLTFSLPLLPGALSFLFISTFDRIVLERTIGLTALGLYAVASTLALTLNVIVQGLYKTFEQKLFEKHGTPAYGQVADTLYKYFIVCLTTGGFVLSLYSKEVFLLFTSHRYLLAYEMVPLLTVSVVVAGISTFLGTLLIAEHQQKVITKATLVSVLLTFAGTLSLIRLFGAYGAILTSIASFLCLYVIYLWQLRLKNHYIAPTLLLLASIPALCYGINRFDLPLLGSMAIKAVLSVLFFGGCLALFKVRLSRKMALE